jgi:hypothetical protein
MPVVLKLQNLRVRSLDVDFNEVSWELAPTSEDVFDYTFAVLRSESAMGPFDELVSGFEDRYLFIDNNIKAGHNYRQYHYKIRVTHKASVDTEDFGPVSISPDADLAAVEIRKHMNLLMREFAGRRCWLLPRRTFGQRCGCWDNRLQKKTRSGCVTCYDTSYVYGYLHPIETWVQIDPTPKAEQPTNVSKLQQENTTARCGYFPEMKPKDIIIEAENKRWKVVKVTQTEKGRAIVHQELELHRIPSTDIDYKIELVLDHALRDLFISPARNFTNPHTLESFEREEIPRIYGLYESTYPQVKS